MAAIAFWATAATGFLAATANAGDALKQFHKAVTAYMALHEAVERTASPQEISPDGEKIRLATEAMATAMRAARPSAKEGDIFDTATASVLRGPLDAILGSPGCEVEDILDAERDEGEPAPQRPLVHDRFDWGAGSFMPSCLLRVLPELPGDLQYRFVERDLVLVDIHADLVVDVLPDALPAGESWAGVRYAREPRGGCGISTVGGEYSAKSITCSLQRAQDCTERAAQRLLDATA
jgi:hypothetical protein